MDIIKEIEIYILQFFEDNIPASLNYHSIEHTKLVAEMTSKIADEENLDDLNKNIVLAAAWFHDIGYAISYQDHESESCRLAREFLGKKGIDESFIVGVEKCIKATKIGSEKQTLNEKIISDADHSHTGMVSFMELSNLYRKEICNLSEKKLTKIQYWEKTLKFLKDVHFLTKYGQDNMEEVKNQNILKVEKRIKKLKANKSEANKKPLIKSTSRGVETMFRLTARNQINLSSIADNKANIMLTINSVLLSILISTSALNFQRELNFLIPGIILVVACLISLVFSILSVRPNISTGEFSDEDIKKKNVNLLFFGNFYGVEYPQYERAIKTMMDDYDFLYGNLILDQYNLGKVLSRKYRLLSFAYNFFMVGFITAVLTFFGFMIFGS